MALPSLAFGIGLSGKPIDRAALNLRREEGARKAKAAEVDDKRKKLEPYQKMIMDIGTKSYLPFQRKIIQEKQAGLWKYIADNAENVDYSQLGGMMTDLSQSAAMYQDNYKTVTKAQSDPKNAHQREVFDIFKTIEDAEGINNALSKFAGFSNAGVNTDNTVNFTPSPFTTVTDYTAKFVSNPKSNLFQSITDGTLKDIYDRKVVTSVFKPEVYETVVQGIYKDPNQFNSAQNEYFRILQQQNQVPDFTTQEGVDKFNQELDQYIRETSKQTLDNYTKETLLKQGGGGVNIRNIFPADKENPLQPIEGNVIVNYNGVPFSVKVAGGIGFGDRKVTFPTTDETVYAQDGTRPDNLGDEITTNFTGAAYTLDKDFVVPADFIVTNDRGQATTIKAGTRYSKGALVPLGYERDAMQVGASFSPKVVAFGKVSNSDEWIVQPANKDMQSRYLSASAANKKVIEDAVKQQEELKKQMSGWKLPKKMIEAKPPKTPSPTPPPAPSGNANSRIESNSSLQDLIKKRKTQ
jgi:hypothetical protein